MTFVRLTERHGGFLHFETSHDVNIGAVFQFFEDHKSSLQIFDYGISETTLEQVFLSSVANASHK